MVGPLTIVTSLKTTNGSIHCTHSEKRKTVCHIWVVGGIYNTQHTRSHACSMACKSESKHDSFVKQTLIPHENHPIYYNEFNIDTVKEIYLQHNCNDTYLITLVPPDMPIEKYTTNTIIIVMMNVDFMYSIMTLKYGEYLKLTAVSWEKKNKSIRVYKHN